VSVCYLCEGPKRSKRKHDMPTRRFNRLPMISELLVGLDACGPTRRKIWLKRVFDTATDDFLRHMFGTAIDVGVASSSLAPYFDPPAVLLHQLVPFMDLRSFHDLRCVSPRWSYRLRSFKSPGMHLDLAETAARVPEVLVRAPPGSLAELTTSVLPNTNSKEELSGILRHSPGLRKLSLYVNILDVAYLRRTLLEGSALVLNLKSLSLFFVPDLDPKQSEDVMDVCSQLHLEDLRLSGICSSATIRREGTGLGSLQSLTFNPGNHNPHTHSGISELTELTHLEGARLVSASQISSLTNLRTLWCLRVDSLHGIEHLQNLEALDVSTGAHDALQCIGRLPNLCSLVVHFNNNNGEKKPIAVDLSHLCHLGDLTFLTLKGRFDFEPPQTRPNGKPDVYATLYVARDHVPQNLGEIFYIAKKVTFWAHNISRAQCEMLISTDVRNSASRITGTTSCTPDELFEIQQKYPGNRFDCRDLDTRKSSFGGFID
jgi:hypothetical protein